jgi:alpha-methylacyl-CoA racemase
MFSGFLAGGQWSEERGVNILDTGAPWYDVYETADRKYVAIGAIEDKFFAELAARMKLLDLPAQHDRSQWPKMRQRFAEAFKAKTRDEWCRIFEGADACFAPVLSWSEARAHPHSTARSAYMNVANVDQPAPAPRFSRTSTSVPQPPPERGQGGEGALRDWGFTTTEQERLRQLGLNFSA